ncbi:hypothetical protein FVE85_0496 [Porphyridium purpureum]|uniref:Uncharacterized protein n=1 Tax=Porphyridium purpureum TaxID=35688 RepID=A0A5J4Z282_PORPP|nr:hypothetical protein FVE85_0496 [Porphyridium purpureum]|eukprot:POR4974..scf208_2
MPTRRRGALLGHLVLAVVGAFGVFAVGYGVAEGTQNEYCRVADADPQFVPDASACEGIEGFDPTATIADAREIAWRYSPLLHFHPLEVSFIDDGQRWLEEWGERLTLQRAGDGFFADLGPVTTPLLFTSGRDVNYTVNANNYYWVANLDIGTEDWKVGGSFDAQNRSEAKVYFSAYEYSQDIWVLDFWYWYPFQNCSNQWAQSFQVPEFGQSVASLNTLFTVCNLGVHDGDLETVTVMVCKNRDAQVRPLSLRYWQHGHAATNRNCSNGECNFVQLGTDGLADPWHPYSFSALYSHASYDLAATNMVYAAIPIPFVENFAGVLLTDRTSAGVVPSRNKRFVPRADNHVFLKNFTEIDPVLDPELEWLGFAGRFGLSNSTARGLDLIYCMDNETALTIVDCPTDQPFFNLVQNFYGFNASSSPNLGPLPTSVLVRSETQGNAPPGPYGRIFWHNYTEASAPPLYETLQAFNSSRWNMSTIQNDLCPLATSSRYFPGYTVWSRNSVALLRNVVIFVVIAFLLSLLEFVALGVPWLATAFDLIPALRKYSLVRFVPFFPESRKTQSRLMLMMKLFYELLWVITCIVGFSLFVTQLASYMDFLKQYFSILNWDAVAKAMLAVSSIGLTFSFIGWILQAIIFFTVVRAQGSGENIASLQKYWMEKPRKWSKTVLWMSASWVWTSILGLYMFLAAYLLALFGLGSAQVFLGACNGLSSILSGICLNLGLFSGRQADQVCGSDVATFCGSLSTFDIVAFFWGGALLLYAGVFNSYRARSNYYHVVYTMNILSLITSEELGQSMLDTKLSAIQSLTLSGEIETDAEAEAAVVQLDVPENRDASANGQGHEAGMDADVEFKAFEVEDEKADNLIP